MSKDPTHTHDWKPHLKNEVVELRPLRPEDFETLYRVASDPLIWKQHPIKDRYKKEAFENFFKGALESGKAFLILDRSTGEVIGSSRFYDWEPEKKEIHIGYTFLSRKYWGAGSNRAAKQLMLDYAFKMVESVVFHVGAENIRSQKAMERLGAKKIGEKEIAYYGERNNLNYVYKIDKRDWLKRVK